MKKTISFIFQICVVCSACAVFVFMLWEPHLEGRNVGASFTKIYFHDPFLIYAYASSIAFFVMLYRMFLLGQLVRQDQIFTRSFLKSLRIVRYCALILIGCLLGAELYFFIVIRGSDDIAGGVALGLFGIVGCAIIASISAVVEKKVGK